MRNLSSIANEILVLVYYKADFEKAEQLFATITDPVEKMYSRTSIANFLFWFAEDEKVAQHLEEFKRESKNLTDPFDRLWALFSYYTIGRFYYAGGNNPSFDEKIGIEYSQKAVSLIENNSDLISKAGPYFSALLEGFKWYHLSYSTTNENSQYSYMLKSIEKLSEVPIHGSQLKHYGNQGQIVNFKLKEGKIDEAKQVFYAMNEIPEQNYWMRTVRDDNLASLEFLSGNIDKAITLSKKLLEENRDHNFTWGIYRVMSQLARYFTAKGQIKEAKELYMESLEYRKRHTNPVEATIGYYDLIRLLTIEYQLTHSEALLIEAKDFFSEMQLIKKKFSSNRTVNNFTDICRALIGKFGRLKDRAKAQEIFEEMIEYYPKMYDLKLDLLEILFEEAQISNEIEIIKQIDNLIESLSSIGLFTSNTTPARYIQLQLFISRYEMFVKGNISQALKILQVAQESIKSLNLKLLSDQITFEIESISKKIKQWELTDLSIQDRLRKGEIDKYIKNALPVIND